MSTLAKVEATTAHVQLEADATVIELEEAWKLCVHTQKALQAALPECVERMEGAEVGEDGPRQIEALLHEVDAMSRRITEDGLATKMAAAAQRLSKAEEGSTALDGQRGAALRAKTKKDLCVALCYRPPLCMGRQTMRHAITTTTLICSDTL